MKCPNCGGWVKEEWDKCPYCGKPLHSSPPITWQTFSTWVDSEGYIGATIRKPARLWARFEIYQSDEERGGIKVLEALRDFVKKELGFEGEIAKRAMPEQYVLFYNKAIEVYQLCHTVLPHLILKHRIKQAKKAIETIEKFTLTQHNRMVKLIQEGKDLVVWAHRREYEEWLRRMGEIKKRYLR